MWGLAMRAPSMLTSVSANRGSALSSPSSTAARATPVVAAGRRVVLVASAAAETSTGERLRLGNLSPAPGSRRPNKRKGRGHASGQGGSCGFGMRGQKSRSGSGVRPGFEGGQTPLYRRVPKLKGIAGGMSAGVAKFVTVNVSQLNSECETGAEVDLASLERLVGSTGAKGKLPLKVLGDGEISKALTVRAAAFSASARAKIEAAGGSAVVLEQKAKWVRAYPAKDGKKAAAAAGAAAPAAAAAAAPAAPAAEEKKAEE